MIEIRYAEAGNAKALGKIQSLSWRAAYKGIVPDDVLEAYTPEVRAEAFEGFLASGESRSAIALLDGEAAGWTCFARCRDDDLEGYGEIWGIYLKPKYWRRGIGTALLLWTLDELKNMGYSSASLWVLEDNADAQAFYERHGFKPDGSTKELEIGRKLTVVRYVRGIGT